MDQSLNLEISAFAVALFSFAPDIHNFVLDEDVLDHFNLANDYGIDPTPLFHLNDYQASLRRVVRKLNENHRSELEERYPELLECVHHVYKTNLLGSQTSAKMAFVRAATNEPIRRLSPESMRERLQCLNGIVPNLQRYERRELVQSLRRLANETRRLLKIQRERLTGRPEKIAAIDQVLDDLERIVPPLDELVFELRILSEDDHRTAFSYDNFARSYCDHITQLIATCVAAQTYVLDSWHVRRGRGIETIYAPRTADFLLWGDRFGDCTARTTRKQVDHGTPNIHWTVPAWLLDPFYRVLLVCVDGEPVLKAHLLPLVICGQTVLAVDALEVIPALRDTVLREQETIHRHLSQRLFSMRLSIVEQAFATACEIGRRMGVQAVIVDKYSNAKWVRNEVDKLPEAFYHIDEVIKPYGSQPIIKLFQRWGCELTTEPRVEVQAMNLQLMDQGLRSGYKNTGILQGKLDDGQLPIRGP